METVYKNPAEGFEPTEYGEPEPSIGIETPTQYKTLYQMWGLQEGNQKTDSVLKEIWKWAREQSPAKDKDSVTLFISKMARRMGQSPSQTPWSRMHLRIKLEAQQSRLSKEIMAMDGVTNE
jgi:hypothetical protein